MEIVNKMVRNSGIKVYNNDETTIIGKTTGMVSRSHDGGSSSHVWLIPDDNSGLKEGTKILANPDSLKPDAQKEALKIVDNKSNFQVFMPDETDEKDGELPINKKWKEMNYDELITFINNSRSDTKGGRKHKSRRRRRRSARKGRKSAKKSRKSRKVRKSRRKTAKKSRKNRRRRRR